MNVSAGPRLSAPGRSRGPSSRRGIAAAAALLLAATGVSTAVAATQVTQKNPGNLVEVGPTNTDYGFPAWYKDSAGTRVELCLDGSNPLCGFLPGDIPNEEAPISFPDNFPDEAFYMLAGSELALPGGGQAVLVLGLEAAFANEVTQGDQVVFGRQRVTVKGAPANTTLTFKHPYGTITLDTDGTGAGRLVEDISPASGNFTAALKSNIGPFLKWDPAVAPAAPAGYLGDPAEEHPVIGSPFQYNRFSVTGGGLDLGTNLFSLQGKIATNHGLKADQALLNGNMIDVFATSGGTQLQVDGQAGKFATTPMLTDPDSGRFYARVQFTGDAPTSVRVTNLEDLPASSSVVAVTKPAGIAIVDANYDGGSLSVAARSANGGSLSLKGYGQLTAPAEPGGLYQASFPSAAPPTAVTVTGSAGGSATLPVTITGGAASPVGLPPVTPEPDPGPIVDPPVPDEPVVLAAVASAAQSTLARGTGTVLDGSASTGAVAYKWSQVSGTPVSISSDSIAKPTVTVPFFAKSADTAPLTENTDPVRVQLVVTGRDGTVSAPATVELVIQKDTVTVGTGSRHRLNDEMRITGTAVLPGTTGALSPATTVVIYDNTPGRAVRKLGTAQVSALNTWELRQKPGPAGQITSVLIQSSRGGTATGTVAAR